MTAATSAPLPGRWRDAAGGPSLHIKLAAASGAALLVLVLGVLAYAGLRQYRDAAERVEHTTAVRTTLARVPAAMAEAEAAARGFVLTGTPAFAAEYGRAVGAARQAAADARGLTVDNADQQRRLTPLPGMLVRRTAVLEDYMARRRAGGPAAVAAIVAAAGTPAAARGPALSDSVRALVAAADAAEARLLDTRSAVLVRRGRLLDAVLLGGSVVAFLLIVLVLRAIRRDVLLREAAQRRVAEQAEVLAAQARQLEAQQARLAEQLEEQQVLTEELTDANAQLADRNARLAGAQARRERLIGALERSNRDLDQFAYVASHDLKAPLRGISNLSSWIEEDLADVMTPDAREQMALLRGRVHRMEALIDGILQYSRAGRVKGAAERVDTGALAREVVELLAVRPGAHVEVADGLPVVTAERVPLQQVLLNLVGNALKYAGRDDARVRVSAAPAVGPDGAPDETPNRAERGGAPGWYTFTVADNGPGIAPQYHERVFGIFQTLQSRDRVEGTGIGLSVVKKIVEGQGGRVWVESAEGAGARFHFTWPAAPPAERADADAAPGAAPNAAPDAAPARAA